MPSTVLHNDGGVDRYHSHFFRRVAARCWSCLGLIVLSPVLAQDNLLLTRLWTQQAAIQNMQQSIREMTDQLNNMNRTSAALAILNQASPCVCQSSRAGLYGCMERCRPLPAIQRK